MQNSNSVAIKDEKPDAPSLENLPIELFCLVVKDMPIADILAIASTSKTLEFKANANVLWEQLIHRDFGDVALNDYQRKVKAPDIRAAKLYYKFLFECFEDKIKDYIGFLKRYEIYAVAQSSSEDHDFIEFDKKLKQFANHLEKWVGLNTEARLNEVKKYYSLYTEAISQLASIENQSFQFCAPPLVHAIRSLLSLTATALISLPEVNVNQYTSDGRQDSIILEAMAFNKDDTVIHALLERPDLNLFIKNHYGMNPLGSPHSKDIKTKVLYKMLCAAGADGAYKILPLIQKVCKKDVFQYMISLVKDSASIEAKLKILYFSIAKGDVNYCSALSYYFHEIKSPHDIVRKVKILIYVLEKSLASEVPLNIKHPETIWNDLADWAVDEPKDFMWRIRNESYIEDLEEKERTNFDVDALKTDMDDCDEYKAAEAAVDAIISHEADENDDDYSTTETAFAAIIRHQADESSAAEPALDANQRQLKTLGFAVLGIGVGLAFGLGLGLGAHVHIAATVLSSVISAALTYVLSARYHSYRFIRNEPASTHTQHRYQPSLSINETGLQDKQHRPIVNAALNI